MAEKRKPMRTSWRTRRPKTGPAALVRSGEEAHSPVRRRKSAPGKCDLPTCSTEQKTRNRTMEDRIIELLYRNLQEVFGEGDAARRRAAIQDFYTEDCALYVPPGVFVGHDALDKFAPDLRATHPHFVYTPHGDPQALHHAARRAG